MIRQLRDTIPTNNLRATDTRKIDYFLEQFVARYFNRYGYGHFVLAAYAALPTVVTPDLLHKLWLNFKHYQFNGQPAIIHPVAVSDLLLSSLLEEIGNEVYEMPEPIRQSLLVFLKVNADQPILNWVLAPLEDIAAFLREYIQYDFTPENEDDDAFKEAQEWTANSYLEPGKAFATVVSAFQAATTRQHQMRYKEALEKMTARFSLEIVKDPAKVPQGYKAMEALTSVIRDVVMKRNPARLDELKQEMAVNTDLLTDTPVLGNNIINIEIPEAVENVIQPRPVSEQDYKVLVLVIGTSLQDLDNTEYIAEAFRRAIPLEQLEMEVMLPTEEELNSSDLLSQLQQTISSCTEKDHLVIYISSGAYRQQEHTVLQNGIYDEDIASHLDSAKASSVTLFIEADHSGSANWMDVSLPARAVFTSCRFDQRNPEPLSPGTINDESEINLTGPGISEGKTALNGFTIALSQTIFRIGDPGNPSPAVTMAGLFSGLLERYKGLKFIKPEIELWRTAAPQCFAQPITLQLAFLSQNQNRNRLQFLLRKAAYLHQPVSNLWDEPTAKAFTAYVNAAKPTDAKTYSDHLAALERFIQDRQSKPIFLFVFSDQEKELAALESEKTMIMEKLNAKYPAFYLEILTLENPGKDSIRHAFTAPANRNRIHYFYYAGLDNEGNFRLGREVMDFIEFGKLLDYQSSMKLFVSNTCKSEIFASYISQLGVPYAIGTSDYVYDDFAAQFAEVFFETLERGENFEELSYLQSPSNPSENYGSLPA